SSAVSPLLLFSLTRPLPRSTPFPYTTLFRSGRVHEPAGLVLLDTPRRSAVVEKRVVVNPVAPRIRYTGTCGRGDPNTLVAVKDVAATDLPHRFDLDGPGLQGLVARRIREDNEVPLVQVSLRLLLVLAREGAVAITLRAAAIDVIRILTFAPAILETIVADHIPVTVAGEQAVPAATQVVALDQIARGVANVEEVARVIAPSLRGGNAP